MQGIISSIFGESRTKNMVSAFGNFTVQGVEMQEAVTLEDKHTFSSQIIEAVAQNNE